MTSSAKVKITDIKLRTLKDAAVTGTLEPAWDPGGSMTVRAGGGQFLEVHTDAGLTGIGPGIAPQGLPVLQRLLVGEDPLEIEKHVQRLRYYMPGHPGLGRASVDIALWDLIGKACGQPLSKLWGGSKTKVPAYASLVKLSTPDERADLAVQLMEEGWQALKVRIHHETMREDIETVAKVRAAVGDRMEIMVDANQAQSSGNWQPGVLWDYRRALETARELEQLNCYWLEEPLKRFAFDQLARLNAEVAMPIAGGENNSSPHEFLQMLQQNVYDILQPESMVTEGLSALRKIGTLAEAYGKRIVPHHGGRGLGTIAHLHLTASWAHSPYLETLHEPPIADYRHGFAMLKEPLELDSEGCLTVPDGPGLGVEINPDLIAD